MSTLYVNTITPNSGDTVAVSGSLTVSGKFTIGDETTDTVAITAEVSSSIVPDADSSYNLGSNSKRWADGYIDNLSGSSAHLNQITASAIQITDDLSVTDDLTLGDNLLLNTDSSVISMGVGADFQIVHDGSTGATIKASPITVQSTGDFTLSGSAHVKLTGSSDVNIHANTGDVVVNAGDDVSITAGDNIALSAADDISLTSTSADGLITLHSAHTSGQSILIDANANEGSILDIDAGRLDIDTQLETNISSSRINLSSSIGDINLNAADNIDLTATDNIALTSTSADGLITLHSAHTAGQSILIDANANAASELDIDAGILKIDTQLNTTITSTRINLSSSVGISGSVTPHSDNAYDLGSSALQWKDLYINGTAYIDALDGGVSVGNAAVIPSISSSVEISGSVTPHSDNAYDLGSSGNNGKIYMLTEQQI